MSSAPAPYLAACVQLRSTEDTQGNLDRAERLIRRAAARGAALIATPEATPLLGPQFHKVERAEPLDAGDPLAVSCARFSALAAELKVHLLLGSLAERRLLPGGAVDPARCYNTSVLFGPDGAQLARYRKIHLFDVDVGGGAGAVSIRESDTVAPGDEVVVATTPLGRLGLSVCYDLRFPELYRALVDRGADVILVPSAFTLTTGKDHWHALLRARAIECQAWILAPGQWGQHDAEGRRQSYGHSLVVDPWGCVAADAGQGEGVCYAEVDLARVAQVRAAIPVRAHRRL
ncbi:MAG: carbon-nitrogen hydrolase family protein [Deltaproteobacteria bacterium]|nr:carbon-nitrogen hydrolase family protein [Deltaproteobacteria bacterium]